MSCHDFDTVQLVQYRLRGDPVWVHPVQPWVLINDHSHHEHTIHVWDVEQGACIHSIRFSSSKKHVVLDSQKPWLCYMSHKQQLWRKSLRRSGYHSLSLNLQREVRSLVVHPQRSELMCLHRDGFTRVDVSRMKVIGEGQLPPQELIGQYHPSGKWFYLLNRLGFMTGVTSQNETFPVTCNDVEQYAFHPHGDWVVMVRRSSSRDIIQAKVTPNGNWMAEKTVLSFTRSDSVHTLAFHPSGAWLMVGRGDHVELWQTDSGELLCSLYLFHTEDTLISVCSSSVVRVCNDRLHVAPLITYQDWWFPLSDHLCDDVIRLILAYMLPKAFLHYPHTPLPGPCLGNVPHPIPKPRRERPIHQLGSVILKTMWKMAGDYTEC